MRSVRASTKELLERVIANRERHQAKFEAAHRGWMVQVEAALKVSLAQVQAGTKPDLTFTRELPEPVSHAASYDQAIEMLRMHRDPEVEVDAESFGRLCQDAWEWSPRWLAANLRYLDP